MEEQGGEEQGGGEVQEAGHAAGGMCRIIAGPAVWLLLLLTIRLHMVRVALYIYIATPAPGQGGLASAIYYNNPQ